MELRNKIVDFRWCKRCEHWLTPEDEDPCNECLDDASNEYSSRPTKLKLTDEKSE